MTMISSQWSVVTKSVVFYLSLCTVLCTLCSSIEAQQTGKLFRIGFLDNSTASGSAVLVDAFRQEMSKLGWIEGKNITIEYRFGEQNNDRLSELAADLALSLSSLLSNRVCNLIVSTLWQINPIGLASTVRSWFRKS